MFDAWDLGFACLMLGKNGKIFIQTDGLMVIYHGTLVKDHAKKPIQGNHDNNIPFTYIYVYVYM